MDAAAVHDERGDRMGKEGRIAVLGEQDAVEIFRAIGAEVVVTNRRGRAEKEIHRLARAGFDIIYVTEGIAEMAKDAISRYEDKPLPAIVPIPGPLGSNGLGQERVEKNIERAVGTQLP